MKNEKILKKFYKKRLKDYIKTGKRLQKFQHFRDKWDLIELDDEIENLQNYIKDYLIK